MLPAVIRTTAAADSSGPSYRVEKIIERAREIVTSCPLPSLESTGFAALRSCHTLLDLTRQGCVGISWNSDAHGHRHFSGHPRARLGRQAKECFHRDPVWRLACRTSARRVFLQTSGFLTGIVLGPLYANAFEYLFHRFALHPPGTDFGLLPWIASLHLGHARRAAVRELRQEPVDRRAVVCPECLADLCRRVFASRRAGSRHDGWLRGLFRGPRGNRLADSLWRLAAALARTRAEAPPAASRRGGRAVQHLFSPFSIGCSRRAPAANRIAEARQRRRLRSSGYGSAAATEFQKILGPPRTCEQQPVGHLRTRTDLSDKNSCASGAPASVKGAGLCVSLLLSTSARPMFRAARLPGSR